MLRPSNSPGTQTPEPRHKMALRAHGPWASCSCPNMEHVTKGLTSADAVDGGTLRSLYAEIPDLTLKYDDELRVVNS